MLILSCGEAKKMSVIIGVCGTNFCTFVSDGRLVAYKGDEWTVSREDFKKIVQINDDLIYGATGVFREDEDILDPLKPYPDKNRLTMDSAYKAIIEHAEKIKYRIPCARNYLLGGKDKNGEFVLCEVHINFETYAVEAAVRKPERITASASTFCISCALPLSLTSEKEMWVDKVEKCVRSSTYHREMVDKISNLIREIADKDETVGKRICVLTVQ